MFAYGFAKGDRGSIREDELQALRALAVELLGYDNDKLAKAVAASALIEATDG